MCKAPTALGEHQFFSYSEFYMQAKSNNTNQAADTWAGKKVGAGSANDRPNSGCLNLVLLSSHLKWDLAQSHSLFPFSQALARVTAHALIF